MVSDLKTFPYKGCKITAAKKKKLRIFFHFFTFFKRLFAPLPEVQCPNFFDFRNPWGEKMERSCFRLKTFGLLENVVLLTGFFVFILLSASVDRCFVSHMREFF